MDVFGGGLVVGALRLAVSPLVWWLRVRWQIRTELQLGWLTVKLAVYLRHTSGRLLERRADGSVLDGTVIGLYGDR